MLDELVYFCKNLGRQAEEVVDGMNENLIYWIALNRVEGLGPIKLKKLLEQYSSPKVICEMLNCDLAAAKEELQKLDLLKVKTITFEDEAYPTNLKNIYDPPSILFVRGELEALSHPSVAIVGTRRATNYGLEKAKILAFALAQSGITIVSGLALGIDAAAHAGALEAQGKTLAVLGSGIDLITPIANFKLGEKIMQEGAIISEYPLGQTPEKWTFPRRNRIISGLSLGVIVVEGDYDSGAMITAKQALDQGREVFAVPGQIGLDQSKGPHWLIKQGAKLVECVEDVLEELQIQTANHKIMSNVQLPMSNECPPLADYSNLNQEENKIVSVLSREPKHIDAIAFETGFSIPETSSLLMMLEIKKIVTQVPGKRFSLCYNQMCETL